MHRSVVFLIPRRRGQVYRMPADEPDFFLRFNTIVRAEKEDTKITTVELSDERGSELSAKLSA
jgi:hypothetical protein